MLTARPAAYTLLEMADDCHMPPMSQDAQAESVQPKLPLHIRLTYGPPRLIHAALLGWLVWRAFGETYDPFPGSLHIAACVAAPLGLYYLLRIFITLHMEAAYRRALWRRRYALYWLFTPLAFVAIFVFEDTTWLKRWRFDSSRPMLEAYARELLARPAADPRERDPERVDVQGFIGDVRVSFAEVDHEYGHVYFITGGMVRGWGLAYLGEHPAPSRWGDVPDPGLAPGWTFYLRP